MRKAWAVFGLVLLIGLQLTFLSFFHQVDASGPAYGTTDVCVARWNYVQATVRVAVSSGPGPVGVALPNGTKVTLPPSSTYSVTLSLPRTGDFFGNAGASVGALTVSQSSPIAASIDANVSSFPFSNHCLQLEGIQYLEVTSIMVTGEATVSLTGYGVAL